MKLYSPEETARLLGISPAYLAKMRMKNDHRTGPDFVKIGKLVRYKDEAINAYIQSLQAVE